MNPNFFIVGAPKSGTTNISYYLNQHPQVFMPDELEPYYFARLDVPLDHYRYVFRDKEKYLKLFKGKNEKAVGESSPVYLYCPNAALDIKKHFPESKIIISLRNPIEIAQSQYFSSIFVRSQKKDFTQVINESRVLLEQNEFHIDNILEAGFYSKHISRFKEIFPENQIKIIIFEEYISNIFPTLESILKFLGIDEKIKYTESAKGAYRIPKNKISKTLLESDTFRKLSRKLIPNVTRQKIGEKYFVNEGKKPSMLKSDRDYLKKIYEEDVRKLEEILERKLPWDDFN